MATEPPLPYDLHDSNDLGRFTHVAPSTLTDSEHEVIVEADSDSDIPSLKARKDRSSSSLPVNGRKKGPVIKKKPPPIIDPQPIPLIPEDLLYHLMDQNKVLMDQNKALTQRLEPSDPFPIFREEIPVVHERPIMPEYPPSPPHFQPCPEQFQPEFPQPPQPMKRRPKEATEDKLYTQCKELWDVLPRVLRVLEAAAPAPTTDPTTAVKSNPWVDVYNDPFTNDVIFAQCSPYFEPGASHEERMLAISKDAFLKGLAETERRFGLNPKPKKYSKKAKSKTDNNAKFKITFDRDDLMPYAWKALGLLQNFLLVFVMIQLSLVGGDMFQFLKKSPKNSSWLGF